MRPSDHSEPPRDQPIAMLPTIAKLIDGSFAAAQEHYATLSKGRAKPHVLDDATLSRSEQVIGEDLEWIEVYESQLDRWQTLPLTAHQRAEVRRLAGELGPWRAIVKMTLELAAELKHGTIDAIMRTDDAQLGLEVLLGLRPLP
jgi:hypothetical protein